MSLAKRVGRLQRRLFGNASQYLMQLSTLSVSQKNALKLARISNFIRRRTMIIKKAVCSRCMGHRRIFESTEEVCSQCNGAGYTTYPVFTTEEAVELAQHFGFNIEGYEETLKYDKLCKV
jgi:hypothetical protein